MTLENPKHITIQCNECKCRRNIHEGQIPQGECDMCCNWFGWTLFPDILKDNGFKIEDGDEFLIDTNLNPVHKARIISIKRNGDFVYQGGK